MSRNRESEVSRSDWSESVGLWSRKAIGQPSRIRVGSGRVVESESDRTLSRIRVGSGRVIKSETNQISESEIVGG